MLEQLREEVWAGNMALPQNGLVKMTSGNVSGQDPTHLYIYRHRPDVFGVAHTHSVYASTFAVLGRPIPPCLTSSAMFGGEVPIGGFVPIGGEAIGKEIVEKIGQSLVILMQNHGVFTIGSSASRAAKMAIEVEDIAKITYLAMLAGEPIILTEEQVAMTADLYAHDYGQQGS